MGWASLNWASLIVMAYLMGSIPSAYIASRLLKGVDIRNLGDRNPGAANAFRVLGPKAGILVAIADMGKGAVAIVLARGLVGEVGGLMAAGVAAVAGHNWPLFLQFRGGRGAATALGALMALLPLATIPLSIGSLVPLFITRSTTVALSFIFMPLPLLAWYTGASYPLIAYSGALPILVGISHYLSVRRVHIPGEGHDEEEVIDH